MPYKYIITDSKILNGKPIIKGTRISVQLILEWLATGGTEISIIAEYPNIAREAINECLFYASQVVGDVSIFEVKNKVAT